MVVTLLVLAAAVAVAGYIWYDRRSKRQQQQQQDTRDAVLGVGGLLEMIENPLRRGAGDSAASAVGAAHSAAVTSVGAGRAGRAPIYAPPAWVPPSQESPAYYSDVAAAPGTVAEYVALNELGGSAVYSGVEAGDVAAAPGTVAEYAALNELGGHTVYGGAGGGVGGAAAYPSPAEGRGSIYVEAISGTAAAYAPTGGAGGADNGALYTNDAYGSVAGSTA